MKSGMGFPTSFNTSFIQPYQDQNPGQNFDYLNYNMPIPTSTPTPMQGNMTEDNLYPMESPYAGNDSSLMRYAKGGRVKGRNNIVPSLAEIVRQHGKGQDTILAHINPLEANMLKQMGGSGTINKATGLPQYGGIFKKPGKALRSVLGGVGGTILGNMIMPGIGGIAGGALGQGLQHKARGKSFGAGALKGGMMGAAAPTLADLIGSGASNLGFNTAGKALTQYGAKNAILPSIGMGSASKSGIPAVHLAKDTPNMSAFTGSAKSGVSAGDAASTIGKNASFTDKLLANTADFASKPKNILSLVSAGTSLMDRPKPVKEKSPEQKADEDKRYRRARRMTPDEWAAEEADRLAERRMERKLKNYRLPEERFAVNPLYRRTMTPDEYERTGRWLAYSSDPDFKHPISMSHGGRVPDVMFEKKEVNYPNGHTSFLMGYTKGQADKKNMDIYEGDYVIPADVVAHQGDGNSMAGGKEFESFINKIRHKKGGSEELMPVKAIPASLSDGEVTIPRDVVNYMGKGNNMIGSKRLDNFVKTIRKAKGGRASLPPKSKSLTSYLGR